ncbi:MAG: TatD family hydrolase [Cyclobacteriaceae bacterium]|nr:TatD family hydrolase [Cyclobacteriaceae bacterium]
MTYSIDTHAHIYLQEFDGDREEVIGRSLDAGVQKIIMPNIDRHSVDALLETEARYADVCVAAMGLHPCSVKKDFGQELYHVEEWLGSRPFIAVGEIGTDLYWDKTFWAEQQEAFKVQVEWAKKYGLPIIIHCRESLSQTIAMVEQLQDGRLRGVFHCFGGTIEEAERITRAGFYLGIGGIATFRNGLQPSVIKSLDLSRVVLETDSPYLTPVPHRGKRNEPAYIPLIAERLSEVLGLTVAKVMDITTANAMALFRLPATTPTDHLPNET